MALKVPTIFTAVDKFSKTTRVMSKSVQSFATKSETAIARSERTFRRLTPSVGSATKQLLQFASVGALIAGAFATFTFVKKFETGLVGVGKTTGIVNEELKILGDRIITASNELKTVSSVKLLELAEAAGQLGVKGSDNIINFASTLAKLEKASDIRGEEGAKSIARLLTITGEGIGIVDSFAATLVELGNSSAASESEILSVASEVGRATAAYKLNSTEILGIAASLKSLDVAPEAAGSAIGKVFRKIELATISGGKKLNTFAKIMELTPKQVKETFEKSPRKAFSLFIKGLGRIGKEGGSLAKTLIDVGLSGERVSKGIIPLATNFELLEEKLTVAAKATKDNTALDIEFAASQKTVQSGIDSIIRSWNNLITRTATAGSKLSDFQEILFAVSDNMGTIVKIGGSIILFFVAWKILLITAKLVMIGYNIALGIMGVLSGTASIAIGSNTVALGAYKLVLGIVTAAQWLWNAAMLANPIGLIALGIAALIALVVLIIAKWNEWGAALSLFLGPLGFIISMIQSFRRNWDMIKESFKTGGIVAGLKAIGATMIDSLLMPLQQLLTLIAKIDPTGLAASAASKIAEFRAGLGVNVTTDESGNPLPKEAINPKVAEREALAKTIESTNNANVNINVNDPNQRTTVTSDSDIVEILTSSTLGLIGQ